MDLLSSALQYLYWYLGIGVALLVITVGAVQVKKRLFPSFAQKLLNATAADKKKAFGLAEER
jgi:hypothetical protein